MRKITAVLKFGLGHRWWLSGDELCLDCGQSYAYELQRRCADCDEPSCPHCVVSVQERSLCSICACNDMGGEQNG